MSAAVLEISSHWKEELCPLENFLRISTLTFEWTSLSLPISSFLKMPCRFPIFIFLFSLFLFIFSFLALLMLINYALSGFILHFAENALSGFRSHSLILLRISFLGCHPYFSFLFSFFFFFSFFFCPFFRRNCMHKTINSICPNKYPWKWVQIFHVVTSMIPSIPIWM